MHDPLQGSWDARASSSSTVRWRPVSEAAWCGSACDALWIPPACCSTLSDLIRKLHLDYLRAGADVLITASYQARLCRLCAAVSMLATVDDLFRRSVTLAADARNEFWAAAANRTGRAWPLVAAPVGPHGALLADGSGVSRRLRALGGGVDGVAPAAHGRACCGRRRSLRPGDDPTCLAEVEALAALLAEFPHYGVAGVQLPRRRGALSGEPMAAAARLAAQTGADRGGGVNCTAPRLRGGSACRRGGGTAKPLLCYPNSGEAWDAAARCWVEGSGVTGFASRGAALGRSRRRLIGGCCRTTPADIAVIAQALRGPGPRPACRHCRRTKLFRQRGKLGSVGLKARAAATNSCMGAAPHEQFKDILAPIDARRNVVRLDSQPLAP